MMKEILIVFFLLSSIVSYGQGISYRIEKDVRYTNGQTDYEVEKCRLDFYYPENKEDFTTLIWFHGGGLTGGGKQLPDYLLNKGIAIIGAGYRLAPKVDVVDILEDAADVVKWAFENVEKVGGNKSKIVVGGISAGAYLSLMIGLDKNILAGRGISADSLLGVVSFSGQTITHFTARKQAGINGLQPVIDKLAPLYWVRKDAPKVLLITGDRELELMGRYEENAYLYRMLKLVGHTNVSIFELDGYGHDMEYPAYPILLKKIEEWSK
ncbi:MULTISPECIES: alpha/beta hydrolase [Sphingobacterium]|uniref:alpha/beta hydrolase n=1 Tax=Sphingobacterium TaxID=28453 RepID=UPI001F094FB7|nr:MULTISPECIES: alpha/beta hydrolase [unclassified Sphingobacterium]